MPVTVPDLRQPHRGPSWKWWVCGMLLLATTVNYMDRLTLNQLATPIKDEFRLGAPQYGQIESAFGIAFALGAILMGWLADRVSVRWLYPAAVIVWSMAGFATGFVQSFAALVACRFVLGLAEAGNWSCALRTTQRILQPQERTLGNGILQSGAALGAVLTPILVLFLCADGRTWRPAFLVVGTLGIVWAAGWLRVVRSGDLPAVRPPAGPSLLVILAPLVLLYGIDLAVHLAPGVPSWLPLATKAVVTLLGTTAVVSWLLRATRGDTALPRRLFLRRFAALALLVVCINATWHYLRAWLPLFLQEQHNYSFKEYNYFSIAYYLATDVGSLAAGMAALALARRGWSTHGSRVAVFTVCALLTTWSVVAAYLPAGLALLGALLVVGFAALGLFPPYYSFSQDLTVAHQGKLTGSLGCICWMSMAFLHEAVGEQVGQSKSYSLGVACAGVIPLVALGVLVLLWGRDPVRKEAQVEDEMPAQAPEPATGIALKTTSLQSEST